MTNNKQDLQAWFKANKQHSFGGDFHQKLMNKLPPRTPLLPQIILLLSAAIGVGICFAMLDFSIMTEVAINIVAATREVVAYILRTALSNSNDITLAVHSLHLSPIYAGSVAVIVLILLLIGVLSDSWQERFSMI
ncbi:hypothetical protein FACS189452_02310 [Bacteroidia bacterium]|nr:hypothetical protein FACS189452_02310 [Bacteroidia bacterium]GHT80958.1 hypothetical protein FACS189467_4190 [Bacteroidia bacterium]